MFERFTRTARGVVVDAQQQARTLDHQVIGTPHLLLALLTADGSARSTLAAQGITPEAVERELQAVLQPGGSTADAADTSAKPADETSPSDEQALSALGIDVARIREAIESSFGPGALDRAVAEQARRTRGGVLGRLGRAGRARRLHGERGGNARTELDALRHPSSRGAMRTPFSPAAKKTLELSLREAVRLGDGHIDDDHLLLGLLRCSDGVAAGILTRLGTDPTVLRHEVEQQHRRSA
jgi:ATP-dependent Clp protease ATP-binding subunit ClpA